MYELFSLNNNGGSPGKILHAHLQAVYYNCVKLHLNPMSRLGGVALTRYTTPLFVKA